MFQEALTAGWPRRSRRSSFGSSKKGIKQKYKEETTEAQVEPQPPVSMQRRAAPAKTPSNANRGKTGWEWKVWRERLGNNKESTNILKCEVFNTLDWSILKWHKDPEIEKRVCKRSFKKHVLGRMPDFIFMKNWEETCHSCLHYTRSPWPYWRQSIWQEFSAGTLEGIE